MASAPKSLRTQTAEAEAARVNKMLAWLSPELALTVLAAVNTAQRERLRRKLLARHGIEGVEATRR